MDNLKERKTEAIELIHYLGGNDIQPFYMDNLSASISPESEIYLTNNTSNIPLFLIDNIDGSIDTMKKLIQFFDNINGYIDGKKSDLKIVEYEKYIEFREIESTLYLSVIFDRTRENKFNFHLSTNDDSKSNKLRHNRPYGLDKTTLPLDYCLEVLENIVIQYDLLTHD